MAKSNDDSYTDAGKREQPVDDQFVYTPGSAEEKALLRKMDLRIFPAIWVMYLMNYLDRTNIGNAKVAGMEADLQLTGNRYSVALLIFFVGYLLGEVPSNMVLSRSRPSIYLPSIMVVWGIAGGLFSLIQSYTGLVVARFFLGCIESGFFPGVMFLLSSWYRKGELAKRMSWFYSASIVSGAFGGLLAGGITDSLAGSHGIAGWRWLFIIEGVMTVVLAFVAMFLLPDWPHTTRWLSDDEKRLARARIAADAIGSADGDHMGHWASLKAAIFEWRTYMFLFMYMVITGAGTISYFIPTITTSLGYKGKTAQYMTVPICKFQAVTLVCSLSVSASADYFQERPWHAAIPAWTACVCFIINASTLNSKVRYVFLCFGGAGIWSAIPVVLTFMLNTITHPNEKRAISQAIVNMFANLASVYGSFLWPKESGPRYAPGWGTTAALCFACGAIALTMGWLNKKYPYSFDSTPYRKNDPEQLRESVVHHQTVDDEKPAEERKEHA
ncbi:MFS general substrate transporter [Auriculariales sp. MPI-PUGE-AT-0066]|nr:MFS general substrate transporter [Auriculariales sp. MPI-PUGE-AT-0066]